MIALPSTESLLEATLKTRILALVLSAVSLVAAGWTGWHLKQALDIEHELRGQMADLSLVASTASNHPASRTVTLGESSLTTALNEVLHDGHRYEALLAVEAAGVLIGLVLLGRRRPA